MDAIFLVVGSMIGSGIFIVSSDMTAALGSGGWLLATWIFSGVLTIIAAVSYGELSAMYPKAGGQYVYLQEAYNDGLAFLYGWSFFAVIETGIIAAVAVAFAKYTGYLFPSLGEDNILLKVGSSFSISAAQVLGIGSILLLTYMNSRGVKSGKWIQAVFTFVKIAALALLIILGFWVSRHWGVFSENMAQAWHAQGISKINGIINYTSLSWWDIFGALGVAMVGALFSSDAWYGVTFIADEIKNPKRNIGLSLFIGVSAVTLIYVVCNIMYLSVLPINEIALAPNQRVAVSVARQIIGVKGAGIIAILIMISTFGCNNGIILAGARVYYQMAKNGLFFRSAGKLNKHRVPAVALWLQAGWASILCLSGHYSDLLNYIIFTVLLFYILTIAGIFILRKKQPELARSYRAPGYPYLQIFYIIIAVVICIILLIKQTFYSGMGLVIVLMGLPIYALFRKNQKRNLEKKIP